MESWFDIPTISKKAQYVLNNFEHKEKVKRLGIFGSVARGEADSDSDIDLIYEYEYDENAQTDDIITEVRKIMDFEQNLRDTFDPISLSIVDIQALIDQKDYTFMENIREDVIWLYVPKQIQKA